MLLKRAAAIIFPIYFFPEVDDCPCGESYSDVNGDDGGGGDTVVAARKDVMRWKLGEEEMKVVQCI